MPFSLIPKVYCLNWISRHLHSSTPSCVGPSGKIHRLKNCEFSREKIRACDLPRRYEIVGQESLQEAILLMVQKSGDHHLGCIEPCK